MSNLLFHDPWTEGVVEWLKTSNTRSQSRLSIILFDKTTCTLSIKQQTLNGAGSSAQKRTLTLLILDCSPSTLKFNLSSLPKQSSQVHTISYPLSANTDSIRQAKGAPGAHSYPWNKLTHFEICRLVKSFTSRKEASFAPSLLNDRAGKFKLGKK